MWMLVLAVISTVWFVSYWFLVWKRHPQDFPPGPRLPLPLIGDLLSVGSGLSGLQNLTRKFGDVFGFWGGPFRVIVVSSYDLIQEVGAKEEFAGRFFIDGLIEPMTGGRPEGGCPGIISSNGRAWSEQRRFTLHTLRNLGFGKNSLESIIAEETSDLCDALEQFKGDPVDIRNEFNVSVVNALWKILSSEKVSREDPKIRSLVRHLDLLMQANSISFLMATSPLLRKINKLLNLPDVCEASAELRKFTSEALDEHERTYQEDNMRDLIDCYLKQIHEKSSEASPSSFKGQEGKLNLLNVVSDLFLAGSETTSTTLNWAMLFMILNPDVQSKVQTELDQVTGRARLPCLSDKDTTPYTEAVLHEVQRLGDIVPLSVTHCALSDGTLDDGKYFVPKGTMLRPHLSALMHDPKTFPRPNKFDPTRHLTKEGKFEPHPNIMPFGHGRRRCLGETLARIELYLFFSAIMSRFTLEKRDPCDVPSMDYILGTVRSPKPYQLRFISRS